MNKNLKTHERQILESSAHASDVIVNSPITCHDFFIENISREFEKQDWSILDVPVMEPDDLPHICEIKININKMYLKLNDSFFKYYN